MVRQSVSHRRRRAGFDFSTEYQVSLLLVLIFLLVIITGSFSYFKLNRIIDTVKTGSRPDRKLILFKEIYNDLSEAENNVKSFSLTRNDAFAVAFYNLTGETGNRVDELQRLAAGDTAFTAYFDTLDYLVEKKYSILDSLLIIQDEYRVDQAMQQVMESMRKKEAESDRVTAPVISATDTAVAESPARKENFFSRLFKRDRKKKEVLQDTIPASPAPALAYDWEKELNARVRRVQKEVSSRERAMLEVEWRLLQEDKATMDKIRELLALLEKKEAESLRAHAAAAEREAGQTRMVIIVFGLSVSLFLLLAAMTIHRYIRRNTEYQFALDRARKDAEELSLAKERFLANMSHEIRTPLNIISGFLEQVMHGDLDEGQREKLEVVNASSDHLIRLLNDLLDLSRLEAGKLELIPADFSPAAVVADLVKSLGPTANNKHIRLNYTLGPGVPDLLHGDPVRLRQVLLNLVGNAVKFTAEGGVDVTLDAESEGNDRILLVLQVKDTGIGIDEEDQRKIFDEFEQGKGRPGLNADGAGLGLSITRRLVEMQDGTIALQSQPGKGSVFTVRIPYSAVMEKPPDHSGIQEYQPDTLSERRFLVVDDDEYNRRLLKMILEKHGGTVFLASSAEEAIAFIRSEDIDLVLMDVQMPGMKGPEAAAEIRKILAARNAVAAILAVSAAIGLGDLESFRHKGIDGTVPKPYTEKELLRAVAACLKPGYDLTALKDISSGEESFVREMVLLFIQSTDRGLDQLDEFIATGNRGGVEEVAHKISPPCGQLKAETLYRMLKEMESGAKGSDSMEKLREKLAAARSEFNRIRTAMQHNLNL